MVLSRYCCTLGAALLIAAACGGGRVAPAVLLVGGASGSSAEAASGTGNGGSSSGVSGLGASAGASGGTGAEAAFAGAGGAAGSAGVSGAAVGCDEDSASLLPWPGLSAVHALDAEHAFQSDLSGLTYEAPNVLWAVDNLNSKLYRLLRDASGFVPDSANGWALGKDLRFPDGSGLPDPEGVTLGASPADGLYVSSERDMLDASLSRLSVLRYEVDGAATTLSAAGEWDVTALLPAVGSNTGIEAITWVPDSFLSEHGLIDQGRGRPYLPADYGEHGGGLFFVGVEASGHIYGLALNHANGSANLVSSIATPFAGVMGLEFDRDAGDLWFSCDDTCDNQVGILRLAPALGRFVLHRRFARPPGLPNSNNEGFAIGAHAECQNGFKPFYWTDDADADGFSLRVGSIPCACL